MGKVRTDWKGVFPPVVTPFKADGAIDEEAFRKVIDLQVADGAHGIIVAGSTGEWFSVSDAERIRLFEIAKEQIAGRRPLLAGTAAMATDHAVQLTKAAKRIGCDGCMVLPPPYVLPTTREVIAHYKAIADVGLPVMLYNNPGRTQVNLVAAIVDKVAEFDSVVAVKDSSKDLFQKAETCARVKDRLAVFTGMEPYGMTMIQRGAVGLVAMIANVACADTVAYCEHASARRWDEGLRHQAVIDGLYEIIGRYGLGNYPSIKALMGLRGLPGGFARRPYLPPEPEVLAKMKADLARIHFATGSAKRVAAE